MSCPSERQIYIRRYVRKRPKTSEIHYSYSWAVGEDCSWTFPVAHTATPGCAGTSFDCLVTDDKRAHPFMDAPECISHGSSPPAPIRRTLSASDGSALSYVLCDTLAPGTPPPRHLLNYLYSPPGSPAWSSDAPRPTSIPACESRAAACGHRWKSSQSFQFVQSDTVKGLLLTPKHPASSESSSSLLCAATQRCALPCDSSGGISGGSRDTSTMPLQGTLVAPSAAAATGTLPLLTSNAPPSAGAVTTADIAVAAAHTLKLLGGFIVYTNKGASINDGDGATATIHITITMADQETSIMATRHMHDKALSPPSHAHAPSDTNATLARTTATATDGVRFRTEQRLQLVKVIESMAGGAVALEGFSGPAAAAPPFILPYELSRSALWWAGPPQGRPPRAPQRYVLSRNESLTRIPATELRIIAATSLSSSPDGSISATGGSCRDGDGGGGLSSMPLQSTLEITGQRSIRSLQGRSSPFGPAFAIDWEPDHGPHKLDDHQQLFSGFLPSSDSSSSPRGAMCWGGASWSRRTSPFAQFSDDEESEEWQHQEQQQHSPCFVDVLPETYNVNAWSLKERQDFCHHEQKQDDKPPGLDGEGRADGGLNNEYEEYEYGHRIWGACTAAVAAAMSTSRPTSPSTALIDTAVVTWQQEDDAGGDPVDVPLSPVISPPMTDQELDDYYLHTLCSGCDPLTAFLQQEQERQRALALELPLRSQELNSLSLSPQGQPEDGLREAVSELTALMQEGLVVHQLPEASEEMRVRQDATGAEIVAAGPVVVAEEAEEQAPAMHSVLEREAPHCNDPDSSAELNSDGQAHLWGRCTAVAVVAIEEEKEEDWSRVLQGSLLLSTPTSPRPSEGGGNSIGAGGDAEVSADDGYNDGGCVSAAASVYGVVLETAVVAALLSLTPLPCPAPSVLLSRPCHAPQLSQSRAQLPQLVVVVTGSCCDFHAIAAEELQSFQELDFSQGVIELQQQQQQQYQHQSEADSQPGLHPQLHTLEYQDYEEHVVCEKRHYHQQQLQQQPHLPQLLSEERALYLAATDAIFAAIQSEVSNDTLHGRTSGDSGDGDGWSATPSEQYEPSTLLERAAQAETVVHGAVMISAIAAEAVAAAAAAAGDSAHVCGLPLVLSLQRVGTCAHCSVAEDVQEVLAQVVWENCFALDATV